MQIRRLRPEEYDEAGAVTASAYAEYGPPTSSNDQVRANDDWDAYFTALKDIKTRDERAEVWVVEHEGRIIGTLTLETDQRSNPAAPPLAPDAAYVRMLGIDPGARHLGAGTALMLHAIERARAAGKSRLTLNTTPRMLDAQALYERLGFTQMADEVFDDGFTLLTYVLTL